MKKNKIYTLLQAYKLYNNIHFVHAQREHRVIILHESVDANSYTHCVANGGNFVQEVNYPLFNMTACYGRDEKMPFDTARLRAKPL